MINAVTQALAVKLKLPAGSVLSPSNHSKLPHLACHTFTRVQVPRSRLDGKGLLHLPAEAHRGVAYVFNGQAVPGGFPGWHTPKVTATRDLYHQHSHQIMPCNHHGRFNRIWLEADNAGLPQASPHRAGMYGLGTL
jgi:hypothetical protein